MRIVIIRISIRVVDLTTITENSLPMPRIFGAAAYTLGLAMAVMQAAGATEVASPVSTSTEDVTAASSLAVGELDPIVVSSQRLTDSLWEKNTELDKVRDKDLLPKLGATDYNIDQAALQALPQGRNTPLDKVLLQTPGVSYDSAISNPDFHVRNEYANVQYRINGIQLPDGVSALGSVLETGFVGNLNLLDGALPAQYGLRTAAVVDIITKTEFDAGGNLDLYGGSWETVSPSIEYGSGAADTQYFLTGRYLVSDQGLENATPMENPIHDRTMQEKFFGYGSTLFGDSSRLTYMAGGFVGRFQIPDVEGQAPLGDFGPATLSSASLNENETDRFFFAVVALQTHGAAFDTQFSMFTRYATVDFVPDVYGDLAFNDVASNVVRKSLLNGLQADASGRLTDAHTLRAGWTFSIEKTQVQDLSTVLPLNDEGDPLPTPIMVNDYTSKIGWTAGGYVQDEWRMRPDLTLNTGVRFDQMNQFVSANQVSPRIALIYKPVPETTLHAGASRYFTPPMQAQATQDNLALFRNTVQQPAISLDDPVRPERSTYFDVGVDQQLSPGLALGLDVYYKRSTDTLDDGQFGQAVVLNEFNFARGFSRGAEFKLNYTRDGFRAYANVSHEITMVKNVVSNQDLIDDPVEFAYLATHYTYASDAQTVTASAGAAYRWHHMLASIDGFYGSGLRAGFANEQHTPGYTQWNAGVGWECDPWDNQKPLTIRLSAVNIFDRSYLLRGATGIGEFAPQYGPRRGIFAELNQRF
jgi:outer membrane receptor protein involved in Fe transport